MPKLDKFDDYNECFGIFQEEAKYCFVRTYIKPNLSSDLYKFIAEFSSNQKQHLRHDKLSRGICLNRCVKTIQRMGEQSNKYFVPLFEVENGPLRISLKFLEYQNASADRQEYDRLINQCVNLELMESYQLEGFSSIEYCTNGESSIGIGNNAFLI